MISAGKTTSGLITLTLVVGLSGCSWFRFFGDDDPYAEKYTIARVIDELPDIRLPVATVAKPTREEVMLAYEKVYGRLPGRNENHAVGKRLADLQMSVGEERDIAGGENPYGPAVELYESLLLNDEGESRDEILYQLARAYDVVGNTERTVHYLDRLIDEYPESLYIVEGRFR
ncbi:MAG: tetratricopeptide repeat protein, partial [Gammaproteobacteria bacterium]|nr:tetratricopeptide repeat protein [Gammaproteobacteria bacterium]